MWATSQRNRNFTTKLPKIIIRRIWPRQPIEQIALTPHLATGNTATAFSSTSPRRRVPTFKKPTENSKCKRLLLFPIVQVLVRKQRYKWDRTRKWLLHKTCWESNHCDKLLHEPSHPSWKLKTKKKYSPFSFFIHFLIPLYNFYC